MGVVQGGQYIFAFYFFPVALLCRWRDLDLTSQWEKQYHSSWFFDKLYPVVVLLFTIAAVPYFFALSGFLPEDTVIHVLYTGYLVHMGVHHGWIGWFMLAEGYFYHRLNRRATMNRQSGEVWRNILLIFGIFLFWDDYWTEMITTGVLQWLDPFAFLDSLLPFDWWVNFAIELGILFVVVIVAHGIYFHHKNQKRPSQES